MNSASESDQLHFSEAIFISFYTNFPYHFFSQLLFDDDDVCIILALNGLLLSCRVAALSERRVKQNQSKVEDTLSENRQSKVEEDFANFFDETRMDALEKCRHRAHLKSSWRSTFIAPDFFVLFLRYVLRLRLS